MRAFPLLLALVLAPSAAAQGGDFLVTIEPFADPVAPLSGLATTTGAVEVACRMLNGTEELRFEVLEKPAWATAVFTPSLVALAPCDGAFRRETFKLVVNTTAEAPALTPGRLRLAASFANGTYLATAETPISAGYFSILDAQTPTTVQVARPQTQVTFPVDLTNFGNGETKVFFEIVNKPEGWQVQEPIPVVLAPAGSVEGARQTVNVNLLTPYRNGYLNEVGAVTMKITSHHALRSDLRGDETMVSFLTTVRGWYLPATPFLAGLAALAIAAVAARGRR